MCRHSNKQFHLRARSAKHKKRRQQHDHHHQDCDSTTESRMSELGISPKRMVSSVPFQTSADPCNFRVGHSGWTAHPLRKEGDKEYSLEELLGPQFQMKTAVPLLDIEGWVIGLLAGRPRGPDFDEAIAEANSELSLARSMLNIRKKRKRKAQRRGSFTSLLVGVSFGGGQKIPHNISSLDAGASILDAFLHSESQAFSQIAAFASDMFCAYAPHIFQVVCENLEAHLQHDPTLRRNFEHSIFAAATFNIGPVTITRPHIDHKNFPWGWCAITALGSFDPDVGGHLVLWDIGIVIRFPAGSTILIPSALLKHSNVTIREGDTRCSFTQYTAGGLLRYAYNGFRSSEVAVAAADSKELQEREIDRQKRQFEGVEMFSTIQELWPHTA